jgi:hypothetical protein
MREDGPGGEVATPGSQLPPAGRLRPLARLVAAGMLDPELAALAWLLLEDGVPVIVCGPGRGLRDGLLEALVAALRADRRPDPSAPAAEHRLVRVAGPLAVSTPPGLLGAALAATTGRSGLAATIEATDFPGVLAVLHAQGLTDDEISFLGAVLVLGPGGEPGDVRGGSPARVVAAHYLRPVARDAGGHVQRLGPAVLAVWDPGRSEYDHFAWGIYPELAVRTGGRAGDLEADQRDRTERVGREAAGFRA